jgi:hypothetical protein
VNATTDGCDRCEADLEVTTYLGVRSMSWSLLAMPQIGNMLCSKTVKVV